MEDKDETLFGEYNLHYRVSRDIDLFEELLHDNEYYERGILCTDDGGVCFMERGIPHFFSRNGIGCDDGPSIRDWCERLGNDFFFIIPDDY